MNDKNDRRSQRTRQALGDALVDLMMKKGYDAISVKDIIDHANVGRSTFYAHFADKDELFVSQLDRVVDLLSRDTEQEQPDGNPYFPSLGLFRHVGQQWRLYKILTWDSGVDLLTSHLHDALSEKIAVRLAASGQAYELPVPSMAAFLSGSFLTLLKWWLDNKMIYSPEQMDDIFQKLALPGIADAVVDQ